MRDIVVMLAFVGLLPLSFMRPYIGFLVWSWFTLMNPHREAFGFAHLFQFNIIIAIVTLLGLVVSKEKIQPIFHKGTIILYMWFSFSVFTTLFALNQEYSYVFMTSIPIKVYIYIILLCIIVNTEERVISLLWIIIISIGYYGVSLGLVGIFEGGKNLGTSLQFGPLGTMIQDRNHMALALCMVIPIMVYLAKYVTNNMVKKALWGSVFLSVIAVLVSYSRGGWICLLFMGAYYFLSVKNKWIYLLIGGFISIISVTLLSQEWYDRMSLDKIEEDGSLNIRFEAWKISSHIAKDNPLTGGGFHAVQSPDVFAQYKNITELDHAFAAHSIYFEVLGDHGYIGFALFITLIISALWSNFKTRKMINDKDLLWCKDLASVLNMSILIYCLGGAALSMAYYDLFYILIAISFILNIMVYRNKTSEGKKSIW